MSRFPRYDLAWPFIAAISLLCIAAQLACSDAAEPDAPEVPSPPPTAPPPASTTPWGTPLPLGLDPDIPVPADNPMNPEKSNLGKLLFFDPLLSADSTIACSSCHVPAAGGT
ncbi:MAG: cytochrome c peroxidase, partial [Myxococcota bacterium]